MDSRVIKNVAARIDLVLKLRMGRPKQGHGTSDMRSRHGRAAGNRIRGIGGVSGRASACARSSDIWFDPVASIDSDRTAAAKGSDRIGASDQGPDRIGGLVKRRRIDTVEQPEPKPPASTTIMMPAAACASTADCKVSFEQPCEGGQVQEFVVMSGALVGSPCAGVPLTGYGARKNSMHSM